MINREYQASAASRSKWMPPNTPVALADSEMSPSDVKAQRRAQISAEEKIQRVMTEPWHLHFSDINPAHIQGSVCNLESGQRSSSAPVYNQAENVSLCAPSTDPWPTVGAIHLWKGHLSVMLSTLWIWTVVNKQQPSKGELNFKKKWYCNTSISNRIIIKHKALVLAIHAHTQMMWYPLDHKLSSHYSGSSSSSKTLFSELCRLF